jgi:hypothetical protein
MARQPGKSRIRIKLTETQKVQIREATGREVNVLELRLQDLPEPAEGQEEAPRVNNPAGQNGERVRPGRMARLRPAHDGKVRKEKRS